VEFIISNLVVKLYYKNVTHWKKGLAVAGMGAVLGLGFWAKQASYEVARVIDGDTFETTERQLIRIAGIDSPELGLCGSEQAKEVLEKAVLHKKVYIKVLYRDPYMRLISNVYNLKGSIASQLIKSGWTTYKQQQGSDANLVKINNLVKEKQLGIYSSLCTQRVNPGNSDCRIKGNVREKKYYRYPGCGQYNNTLVQLYLGDAWFCSEKEAKAAGFTKASDCSD
jgi:endonuclease YncB( thermonuclease family)